MTTPRDDVVVVGAGLAGLTCARLLERLGLSVRVLERADATGGRVRTDVLSGYRCDRGFQLLNPAYPAVRELIDVRALELRRFAAGVALPGPDGIRVVGRPRSGHLGCSRRTLRSGYLRPGELARLAAWVGTGPGQHRAAAGRRGRRPGRLPGPGRRHRSRPPRHLGPLLRRSPGRVGGLHLRTVRPAPGRAASSSAGRACRPPVWRRSPARSRPP